MLWLKAFHIIAVVAWFSGLFYLPRLFAYHAESQDELSNSRFKTMEVRLYRIIMNPAAAVTVILGLWMIFLTPHYYMSQGWMHAKLLLVALVLVFHVYCGRVIRRFQQNKNLRKYSFYAKINEIPTLLLMAIVILVVVKP